MELKNKMNFKVTARTVIELERTERDHLHVQRTNLNDRDSPLFRRVWKHSTIARHNYPRGWREDLDPQRPYIREDWKEDIRKILKERGEEEKKERGREKEGERKIYTDWKREEKRSEIQREREEADRKRGRERERENDRVYLMTEQVTK